MHSLQFFPYEHARSNQLAMIEHIEKTLGDGEKGGIALIHAPTGTGKSINALVPALQRAFRHRKKLVILVSRVTQAHRFMEEISLIKNKLPAHVKLQVSHLQSKIEYCIFPKVKYYRDRTGKHLPVSYKQFRVNCAFARNTGACRFYKKSYHKIAPSQDLKRVVESRANEIYSLDLSIKDGLSENLCPYELMKKHAATSNIIIGTYSYIFDPKIHESFLKLIDADLDDLILIVDEAHNLPEFIRNTLTIEITLDMIHEAIDLYQTHAKHVFQQYPRVNLASVCPQCNQPLNGTGTPDSLSGLVYCPSCQYSKPLRAFHNLENLLIKLKTYPEDQLLDFYDLNISPHEWEQGLKEVTHVAEFVRKVMGKQEEKTLVQAGSQFLDSFQTPMDFLIHFIHESFKNKDDERFTLHTSKFNDKISLILENFDPSILSFPVLSKIDSAIIMSATLTPTKYYRDVLALPKARTREFVFQSIFPRKNRLILTVKEADVSGSVALLKKDHFRLQALLQAVQAILASNAKTVGVYSRSYGIQDLIKDVPTKRHVLVTNSKTRVDEIQDFIQKNQKTVFFSVQGGRHSEGIEFTTTELGSLLDVVVVAGIQFPPPTPVQKKLTAYYQTKFGGIGWDYANRVPAISKLVQTLGRGQRKMNDKVVLVVLDHRIKQPRNKRYLPPEYQDDMTEVLIQDLKSVIDKFIR